MARRRTINRRELREQAEAAEARERSEDEDLDELPEDEEDESSEEDSDSEDSGDDEKPAAKSKKKKTETKSSPPKRSKAVKEVRMKAIWVVYDNGGKRVKEFPYAQKADAEAFLNEKLEEKKGTFYLLMDKVPIEE